MRRRTLVVGEQLRDTAAAEPAAPAAAITLTLDSTFIRSCEEGQRHLEVRFGNMETSNGARQVFAAVAKHYFGTFMNHAGKSMVSQKR
jgi:hypothetical protein